jgi:arylsulfatase A-like enzyme
MFSLGHVCEQWGLTPPLPWLDQDFGGAQANRYVSQWLDRHRGEPTFVFVNYMEAHLPYRVPRAYRAQFLDPRAVGRSYALRRRAYGNLMQRLDLDFNLQDPRYFVEPDRDVMRGQYEAALRYIDHRAGELIDLYRQRGLLENTLVVTVSDHGEYLGAHDLWGHRFLAYQDVSRVALHVRHPQRPGRERRTGRVQLADLYATVLGAVGLSSEAGQGRDARDLLATADDPTRIAVCEYNGPPPDTIARLRKTTDPRIRRRAMPQLAAVGPRYKLIEWLDGRQELFDLEADPGELRNVIAAHPQIAEELAAYLRAWEARTPRYELPMGRGRAALPSRMDTLRSLGYVGAEPVEGTEEERAEPP